MPVKYSLFKKMLIFLSAVIIPVILLNAYSNRVSVKVVQQQTESSALKSLSYFGKEIDGNVDELTNYTYGLLADPDISSFGDPEYFVQYYDVYHMKKKIAEKLSLQMLNSGSRHEIRVYSPLLRDGVSNIGYPSFDSYLKNGIPDLNWTYQEIRNGTSGTGADNRFVRYAVQPFLSQFHPESAKLIIETSFPESNIMQMLDSFKALGSGDPFFTDGSERIIFNKSSDTSMTTRIRERIIPAIEGQTAGYYTASLDGIDYFITFTFVPSLKWYLVDYVPLRKIIAPIEASNKLFYATISGLIIVSVLGIYMFYRNIQIPIKRMLSGLQKLEKGMFSTRIAHRTGNEFGYLIGRFNHMAGQIQTLIENVYEEKLRSRDAVLKQLQSQINPHFLYNCFSYIAAMSRIENTAAIDEMIRYLSNYYRYSTRLERLYVTIREETAVISDYLNIQKLRMPRLDFDISIPESMLDLEIPILSIQTIVENAVIHGVEQTSDTFRIEITGQQTDRENRILVADNGKGIADDRIQVLNQKLSQPLQPDMGFGLWNVHQRIRLQHGELAGVQLEPSARGGLVVSLFWPTI